VPPQLPEGAPTWGLCPPMMICQACGAWSTSSIDSIGPSGLSISTAQGLTKFNPSAGAM
jgi:hypothetical protein